MFLKGFVVFGTENFDTRKNQLTQQGFMELNLMEATEKGGDTADLWVTLEAMGYNRMLELVEVGSNIMFYSKDLNGHLVTESTFRLGMSIPDRCLL